MGSRGLVVWKARWYHLEHHLGTKEGICHGKAQPVPGARAASLTPPPLVDGVVLYAPAVAVKEQ